MENRVKRAEEDAERLWDFVRDIQDDVKKTAALTTYNSRGLDDVRGRMDLVVFLSGAEKEKVKALFDAFQKESKERKKKVEDKKRAKEEDDTGLAESTASMELDGFVPCKVRFAQELIRWGQEQVQPNGPKATASTGQLHGVLQQIQPVNFDSAVVYHRFHGKDCPAGTWASTLALDGGLQGRTLYDLLKNTMASLYKRPSDVGIRAESGTRDRPLTAQVADIGGVPARTGKAGGKGGDSSGPSKRRSPQREGDRVRRRR